ncbi:N-acetylmuramoyl-L-alanine amidase [Geobacillus stearothermophilus]|uniref:N-acetylmuramoyl-L-alanine amidase n=1 Tax=Geobacillus stearothermophilus TaxID=1422 RepID=UPI002E2254E3|nr:N-acetylmuramoyl-L-alanine amidase [Geobacillus stearothermophilus]
MKKIKWDKGHGGSDPGAVANGLQEKVLTHKIVEYAMDYLEANYTGFEQRTTRTGDQTLTLSQRAKMANDWGADVFISVHINAGKGTGFESYVYNGGVSSQTVALQNVLHDEILAAMRQFGNITDRGKKRANYAVLRETKMPAVLTENLFIDSNDAKLLKNEAFLKAVGEAHARGIAKFLGLPQKAKPQPQPQPQQKVSDKKLYRVQVGAFSDRKNAERLAEELKKKGYPAIIV